MCDRPHAAGAVAGALLALLGGLAGPARADDRPVAGADCLQRAPVVVYLHYIQDQILDEWHLPPDMPSDREVVVDLWIAEDGTLLDFDLVSWSHTQLALSAGFAIERAAPFAAVQEGARCIVGRRIRTTFTNPY